MIKIFTPEQWYKEFSQSPSIFIDDDGLIYDENEYYKSFRNPSGKVDFESGLIYGEDYSSIVKSAIGRIKKNDHLIEIYGKDYSSFGARPIMYVVDDRIYSAEEYTKFFPTVQYYINTDNKKDNQIPELTHQLNSETVSNIPSKLWSGIKILLISVILIALVLVLVYGTFSGETGTQNMIAAWMAVIIGFIFSLIFSKDLFDAIKKAETASVFAFWLYNSVCSVMDNGFVFSTVLLEVILAPFLMIIVFAIPSVITGLISWGIKKLFSHKKRDI